MRGDREDEQPMFASLDELCDRCGVDELTRERIRRDMELTGRKERPARLRLLTFPPPTEGPGA